MVNLVQETGSSFNVNDVPPDEYTPMEAGVYTAVINDTYMKDTSTGGKMLIVEFGILGSQYDGRKYIERLNLVNANPKAENIARQDLAKIARACDVTEIEDTAVLHGKRLRLDMVIEPGQGTYKDKYGVDRKSFDQNRVNAFLPLNGAASAPVQPAPAPVQQDSPVGAKPWA